MFSFRDWPGLPNSASYFWGRDILKKTWVWPRLPAATSAFGTPSSTIHPINIVDSRRQQVVFTALILGSLDDPHSPLHEFLWPSTNCSATLWYVVIREFYNFDFRRGLFYNLSTELSPVGVSLLISPLPMLGLSPAEEIARCK